MNDQDVVPDRLGAYRLLDRIGEGGMGVVYLARDLGHRTVALKVLRSTVAGDPTARRRLAREVETMQRVRSPHVAEVIDADLTGEIPYIVTRFVPGRTLDDLVTECGPLQGPALAALACGLADAMVAVHAAGVVHRDLKPGNVMLVHDTPVVIDFGIAQGPDATRLTMTGMFMGTPGYLAPEVIEGRPSSEASDVHAWGATVGFAATGRPPFGSGSYETIFYRIVNGQADLDGVPATLVPLLAAALARDPAHRPSAIALRAQAALLDPVTLIPAPLQNGARGAAAGLAPAGATRAAMAAGRDQPTALPGAALPGAGLPGAGQPGLAAAGGLAGAGLPPVGLPVANGNGVAGPTALAGAGAAGLTALPGAAAPAVPAVPVAFDPAMTRDAGAFPPSTRPLTTARPLSNDLRDVLPPVRYARDVKKRPGDGVARAPAAAGAVAGKEGAAARSRWQPVLVLAAVLVLASASVVLPVMGTLGALACLAALRTAGLVQRRSTARRQARGARRTDALLTAVSLPWFAIRALVALLLLAPFALAAAAVAAGATVAVASGDWPYRALAYAAGMLVIFYGLGPGSGMPRTQLRRIFGTITRTPAAQVVALIGMGALTAAALTAAVTWPSVFWPTVVPQGFVHFGVTHLAPLRHLSYHWGIAHHIRVMRGYLLRHLTQLRHAA